MAQDKSSRGGCRCANASYRAQPTAGVLWMHWLRRVACCPSPAWSALRGGCCAHACSSVGTMWSKSEQASSAASWLAAAPSGWLSAAGLAPVGRLQARLTACCWGMCEGCPCGVCPWGTRTGLVRPAPCVWPHSCLAPAAYWAGRCQNGPVATGPGPAPAWSGHHRAQMPGHMSPL